MALGMFRDHAEPIALEPISTNLFLIVSIADVVAFEVEPLGIYR